MEGGLLLDVVIGECSTVLKLLAGEDQALLVRRNSFLILNLSLYIVDRIARFDFKGNRLAGDYKRRMLAMMCSGGKVLIGWG